MTIESTQVVPILRIFDVAKAREFYTDFLRFKADWEHRFDDDAPLYMQIQPRRSGASLVGASWRQHAGFGRLCPHDGDRPAPRRSRRAALQVQPAGNPRSALGTREMSVIDLFGNRIRFAQPTDPAA